MILDLRVSNSKIVNRQSPICMTTTEQNIDQILIPVLEKVSDPEIPVLSIMEMGVVRSAVLHNKDCLLYTSPSPRDLSTSRMPSSA